MASAIKQLYAIRAKVNNARDITKHITAYVWFCGWTQCQQLYTVVSL